MYNFHVGSHLVETLAYVIDSDYDYFIQTFMYKMEEYRYKVIKMVINLQEMDKS